MRCAARHAVPPAGSATPWTYGRFAATASATASIRGRRCLLRLTRSRAVRYGQQQSLYSLVRRCRACEATEAGIWRCTGLARCRPGNSECRRCRGQAICVSGGMASSAGERPWQGQEKGSVRQTAVSCAGGVFCGAVRQAAGRGRHAGKGPGKTDEGESSCRRPPLPAGPGCFPALERSAIEKGRTRGGARPKVSGETESFPRNGRPDGLKRNAFQKLNMF